MKIGADGMAEFGAAPQTPVTLPPTGNEALLAEMEAGIMAKAAPPPPAPAPLQVKTLEDGRIPVQFRDGGKGTIDPKDAHEHVRLGGSFLDPAKYSQEKLQTEIDRAASAHKSKVDKITGFDLAMGVMTPAHLISKVAMGGDATLAAELGAVRGATLGLSDAVIFGLDTKAGKMQGAVEALHGKKAADAARQYAHALEQENPGMSLTGEIAGSIIGSLIIPGLGAEGALVNAERKIATMGAEYGVKHGIRGLGGAAKALGAVVKGAPLNAAMGAGQEVSRAALDNDELAAEHLAAGTLKGLLFGAVADVGLTGAGAVWGKLRGVGKPMLEELAATGTKELDKFASKKALEAIGGEAKVLEKQAVGLADDVAKEVRRQTDSGFLGVKNSIEQAAVGSAENLAQKGEPFGRIIADMDSAGVTVPAKSFVKLAEETALMSGTPEVKAAVELLSERSGLNAERLRIKTEAADLITTDIKQKHAPLFEELATLDSAILDRTSKLRDIDRTLTRHAQIPVEGLDVAALKKEQAAARMNLPEMKRTARDLKAQTQQLFAPVEEMAARHASETADVGLKISEARKVKDALKESGDWHTLPDPVKKLWGDLEKEIETVTDKYASTMVDQVTYRQVKRDYLVAKSIDELVRKKATEMAGKGSLASAALRGAGTRGLQGAAGAMFGGHVPAVGGMIGGAVVGGIEGAAKLAFEDRGGRMIANLLSRSAESQTLSKLVGHTDLTMQAILNGSARAGKAAVLEAAEPESRRERFKARLDQVKKYQEDPDKFINSIERQLSGLSEGKRNALLMQVDKTMGYLSGKIPPSATTQVNPLMPNVKRPSRTSDDEISRFNTTYDTAMDPTSAIRAIMEQRYRREHEEALKAVYPQLAQRAQGIITSNMAVATTRPAPAILSGISKVLGTPPPVSSTPEYAARIRAAYGPLTPSGSAANDKAPSQLASRPAMSFQKNSNQRMTTSQSLELGEK